MNLSIIVVKKIKTPRLIAEMFKKFKMFSSGKVNNSVIEKVMEEEQKEINHIYESLIDVEANGRNEKLNIIYIQSSKESNSDQIIINHGNKFMVEYFLTVNEYDGEIKELVKIMDGSSENHIIQIQEQIAQPIVDCCRDAYKKVRAEYETMKKVS